VGIFYEVTSPLLVFANPSTDIWAGKSDNFIVLFMIEGTQWFANSHWSRGLLDMNKNFLIALMLGVLIFACSDLQIQNYDQVFKKRGQPPMIIGYYAPEVIRPGSAWKIYLLAEDKDGDMVYFATMLYQAGFGYYSTDYTSLKGKDRKKCVGYISLRTPADVNLTADKFTMEILVRDSQNNQSETIQLPLTFAYLTEPEIPSEWEASANYRLGGLVTKIQSTASMTEGSGSY
jgi:hypothetical protein